MPYSRRVFGRLAVAMLAAGAVAGGTAEAASDMRQGSDSGPPSIGRGLAIVHSDTGRVERLDIGEALQVLRIPSVSIALIEPGKPVWTGVYGGGSTRTLYQAASLSKFVTAVAALRLVQQGRLDLDRDVDIELVSWHVPASALTRVHPVTLRGLLSMTGGIGVPGYSGYRLGAPLPSLKQILDGVPPANSPPVRVEYVPGSRYAYSGGGYEIVQALIEDATRRSFAEAMQELVLRPAGMADSVFAQPLPPSLAARAATGHWADGAELPGGWRVLPELAAAGLWSTPADLARLLIAIARAYSGADTALLDRGLAREMLTLQNGGPYGLGGAVSGSGRDRVLMKRGQNVGYQGYMLIFPETGQGIAVLTGSDNGTILATALVRRAAVICGWPPLGALAD
jgi:CubicO group peptidase (beta-lactamase class C family)